jgi:hypothetical protein
VRKDDTKGTTTTATYTSSKKRDNILLVIILWIAISMILTVFLVREVIGNSGFIYSRDLVFPNDLSLNFNDLTDTWDNIHSHRNLELNKIPLFLLLSGLDDIIGSENTLKVFLAAVIFTVLFVIFLSLLLIFKEKVKSNIKLIAICAPPSLLYLFNPWVVDRISNHIFLVLGMALTPLIIITYVNLLNRGGRYLKIFSASLLLTGLSVVSTHTIFYIIPILLFISAYYIIVASSKKRKKILLSSLLFFSFYICLNSYWIVPIAYESSAVRIEPSYEFSVKEIERLSQQNTFPNVVQMIGGGGWKSPLMYPSDRSYSLGFLVPIISLFAIGLFPSNKFVILLGIMLVFFLVLALGTNTLIPSLLFSSPLAGVMWIFRDPSRFIPFIVLIYSILVAFALYRITISQKLSKTVSILLISMIIASIGTSFSAYTFANSAGGRLVPSMLPAAFADLKSFLDNDTGNYKVLWLPIRSYLYYDWNKVNDEVAGNIYLQSSPKATYDLSSTQSNSAVNFLRYLYSDILLENRTNQIGEILKTYGIKYVIVFTDLLRSQKVEAEKIIRIMDAQQDMNLVNQFGPYYIYRNEALDSDNSRQFYASPISAAISNHTLNQPENALDSLLTETEKSDLNLEIMSQSPTHYMLRVNSTRPFLLVFTETYDPLWKIKIDGSTFANPMQVYYFLNGFAIDESGQHIIELEYTPQTWFNIGVVATVITLLVFLGYGMIYVFKGISSLKAIDIGSNSAILSETFVYRQMLVRLRDLKRYFSKRS